MALFGQMVAVLSLCLLAAVANSQDPPQPPPGGNEMCKFYTQSGAYMLDMSSTYNMIMNEFERYFQTMNYMQVEQWMSEVDEDHDKRLTMEECTRLITNILSIIKIP